MRKFVILIVLLVGVGYIFLNRAELQSIIQTVQQGDWRYLILAFGIEIIWMLNVAASMYFVYKALGLEERLERLIMMAAAANFVNVVAPTAGLGGLGVFISEARRYRYSSARVTIAGAVVVLFDYLGFLCLLALGLVVLIRRNTLHPVEMIASFFLLLLAGIWIALLYLGMRSERSLGRVLAGFASIVNRILYPIIQRDYLSKKRAFRFALDAAEGLALLRQQPFNLTIPAVLGLTSKILLMLVLLVLFLAFGIPFSTGTIVAGFSMGYLFWIVSPTPAGIGFVEGALTLGLSSLNVSLGAATVLALSYRGITFWLPMLIGMMALRWLGQGEKKPSIGQTGVEVSPD